MVTDVINVPMPINVDQVGNLSADLPVYTQKKWQPNEDEVPDLLFKESPTLAKLSLPKN